MRRLTQEIVAAFGKGLMALLVAGCVLSSASAPAQESEAVVREDVSPRVFNQDLTALPAPTAAVSWREGDTVRVIEDLKESAGPTVAVAVDSVATALAAPSAAPSIGVSFDGIAATGVLPPDTVGDVGRSHYIQMVNSAFSIYDKSGTLLAGPLPINVLWEGFGGPCESLNNGDPIVRYDEMADRWLLSQFALPGGSQGFHECIAVSQTGDPISGGWFLYDFPTIDTATNQPIFPDYPKIGVWPDAYYMGTQRGFPSSGLDVWAFERDEMLVGGPARAVQFAVPAPSLFLLPSDLDGPPPPAGTPNFFARQVDGDQFGGRDRIEVFEFKVDWSNPAASGFTQVASLATAPFDSVLCSPGLMGACVPQPGTTMKLETLTVWPMWRLQYRNFGSYEAMVFNHTVDANGSDLAGVRWYELRRSPGGNWGIFQQGTHAPDQLHRWMGSVAMDREGNLALGYSVSSSSEHPGIRVGSRLATDPPGSLPQPELTLVTGAGSQTFTTPRWGNYSTMDVDPEDNCTFWYTTEYYAATSAAGWRTRVASFRHPSCGDRDDGSAHPAFKYAAKLVCGLQRDPQGMRLTKGYYATAINVHNPNEARVSFMKSLSLTYPPEEQKPGKVIPIAKDTLGPDQALEVDCIDVQRRLFPDGFPTPYIKGFVVLTSEQSLDVTVVYTTVGVDREGRPTDQNSIDVEQIWERKVAPAGEGCPDLVIKDIGRPAVSCPQGTGSCVTSVEVVVANTGTADAGPFDVRGDIDPGQTATQSIAGLNAGESKAVKLTTPPGGNCFDPDCTIRVRVDSTNRVDECNEDNNDADETTLG